MQTITSLRNQIVLAAKSLQSKSGRLESGMFLCDGEHMVGEAIRFAPSRIKSVFVQDDKLSKYQDMLSSVQSALVYVVPAHVLAAIAQVKTPQGIAAEVFLPEQTDLPALGDRLLLLENVQDPGNVGTILRTADAAGFTGCLLTAGCADVFSAKVLRATMGSIFRVPTLEVENAQAMVQQLADRQYAVIASTLGGTNFYARAKLPQKVCLIIGNEGAGITDALAEASTHQFSLPMHGGAESLNAAVAAAIMMYEIVNRG